MHPFLCVDVGPHALGDPAPGAARSLVLALTVNGLPETLVAPDHDLHVRVFPADHHVQLVSAFYGDHASGRVVNVASSVLLVNRAEEWLAFFPTPHGPTLSVAADMAESLPDPAPDIPKVLRISLGVSEIVGVTQMIVLAEGQGLVKTFPLDRSAHILLASYGDFSGDNLRDVTERVRQLIIPAPTGHPTLEVQADRRALGCSEVVSSTCRYLRIVYIMLPSASSDARSTETYEIPAGQMCYRGFPLGASPVVLSAVYGHLSTMRTCDVTPQLMSSLVASPAEILFHPTLRVPVNSATLSRNPGPLLGATLTVHYKAAPAGVPVDAIPLATVRAGEGETLEIPPHPVGSEIVIQSAQYGALAFYADVTAPVRAIYFSAAEAAARATWHRRPPTRVLRAPVPAAAEVSSRAAGAVAAVVDSFVPRAVSAIETMASSIMRVLAPPPSRAPAARITAAPTATAVQTGVVVPAAVVATPIPAMVVLDPSWVQIPISGNAFVTACGPTSSEKISHDGPGLQNLTSAATVISVFVHVATPGALSIAVMGFPGGPTHAVLRMTAAGQQADFSLNPSGTTLVGTFTIAAVGYVKIDLQGQGGWHPLRVYAASISALAMSGPATRGLVFANDPANFYWSRRGPSVHFGFSPENVEYYYSEVIVPAGHDVIGSFFMANGHDRGYAGIQVNSSTERRILVSVWDPPNNGGRTTVIRHGPGVTVNRFGGEGEGGQSYLKYSWALDTRYAFVTRGWPGADGQIHRATWFYAPERGSWQLISEMVYPPVAGAGPYLKGLHCFLENFSPDHGHLGRRALYGNNWYRPPAGPWTEITRGKFTVDDTGRRQQRLDFAGGIEADCFVLHNCSFFTGIAPDQSFSRAATGIPPAVDIAALP
eukprot:m.202245 g.202245  ORF g.202245 m.202245 type:complete len:882 (-) comp10107_c2_seq21:3012-5657(-)